MENESLGYEVVLVSRMRSADDNGSVSGSRESLLYRIFCGILKCRD
jgi:hypothetical protein